MRWRRPAEVAALTVGSAAAFHVENEDRCTTIVVGAKATGEGGPLTSHTVDCAECDFRLSKVPARRVTKAQRPVYRYRAAYPRWLGRGKGRTYESATAYSSKWAPDDGFFAPIGSIPETTNAKTYGYVDGAYGVQNEAGLAIGESTCAAELIAKPASEEGGSALLDVRELTLIAMERCATAVCAVETMGSLAELYGYYGADASHVEAGEALSVVDDSDAWIFHVLADDTGFSAVWAARRVEPDEVAVVANQFIIGDVPAASSLESGFAFSSNVRVVAARAGLWANGAPLHFAKTFGQSRGPLAPYATRRQWRVFSVALGTDLPDDAVDDEWGYDFSLKLPPARWTFGAEAVMDLLRDHYEGTKFDMTQGPASGPFGDPSRFDPADNALIFPGDSVSAVAATAQGRFERAISLFRCAYSFVSQPGKNHPMVWVAQYAPHSASYVPVFAAADAVPSALAVGSLHEVHFGAQYWAHALVGNWAARFYVVAQPLVAEKRDAVDAETRRDVADFLLRSGDTSRGESLAVFADRAANASLEAWWELFWTLAATVKDGQRLDDIHAETLSPTRLFYRASWLKQVGFFFDEPSRLFYVPPKGPDWFTALPPSAQLGLTFFLGLVLGVLLTRVCCDRR
mmetsp:Transcript_1141/g.3290  ORF Transcript_1141/g.3290 Transcript_1141/m.3290 type:complete len:629 (-) Transcript_1141:1757-3643(-)